MTTPTPPEPEGNPTQRNIVWIIAGIALFVGLYLYFRYGQNVAPVTG